MDDAEKFVELLREHEDVEVTVKLKLHHAITASIVLREAFMNAVDRDDGSMVLFVQPLGKISEAISASLIEISPDATKAYQQKLGALVRHD